MPSDEFLLSGDQIATYARANVTFPDGVPTIRLLQVEPLGPPESRFFLVRTKGEGEIVANGHIFEVFKAVPDGRGGWLLDDSPLFRPNWATPDAYENTGAGDRYVLFGLFDGPRFAVDLDGFRGARTATYVRGEDRAPGGDGELSLSEIRAADPDRVVCFGAGTPIETEAGEVAIERLAPGARVRTVDSGWATIRWIGCARVSLGPGPHRARPVRLAAGALGAGVPRCDLLLSPAHRVLLGGGLCELVTGSPGALVPARHLVGLPGIGRADDLRSVDYWHFALDRHEIVFSAGLRSESLQLAAGMVRAADRAAAAELAALFRNAAPPEGARACRAVLRAHEMQVVAGLARGSAASALRIG
jgi:hypothetical protein